MKRRRIPWLAFLLGVVSFAGFLGYCWSGGARPRRIFLGKDVSDIPRPNPGEFRSDYDYYFDRVNHSMTVAVSFTNASGAIAK
jgi:hypothetical protein